MKKKCPVCELSVAEEINICPQCQWDKLKFFLGLSKEEQVKIQTGIKEARKVWQAKKLEKKTSNNNSANPNRIPPIFPKEKLSIRHNKFNKFSQWMQSIKSIMNIWFNYTSKNIKQIVIIVTVLFVVTCGYFIWLFCCPPKVCTLEGYVTMAPVPQNTYYLDNYPNVLSYIRGIGKKKVIIEKSFMIQTGEVTVGEFRRFVESGWLKEKGIEILGTRWDKEPSGKAYKKHFPVSNVPWLIAKQYAQWMSQQTACKLLLPTKEQWAAAVMAYADEQTKQKRRLQRINTKKQAPDYLLFNRGEWSRSSCGEDKVVTLGYDYYPFYRHHDFRRLRCALMRASSSIGFRLVKEGPEKMSTEH
jgi:hypothetical protein